jgi:cullin 1
VQWKDTFFIPIQTKITGAILRLIEENRNGSVIDQDLVKKVVDSYVSLGLDATDINKECLDVYKEHFELPFIDATEKYYKQETKTFLASHSLSEYLKKAEEYLQQEEDYVDRYLNAHTRQPLIRECEQVLIRERSELMEESFPGLLDSDEDLQRMYSLLYRIPEGLEHLPKRFADHVEKIGLAAILKLVGELGSSTELLDPKVYVDALLEIQQKYSEIVTRSFRGDARFVESLDKACREFVNRNAATGQSNSKSRKLIVNYANLLLHEDNKLEKLEQALNRVVCYRLPPFSHLIFYYPYALDDFVQVHRRRGHFENILYNRNNIEAPYPWNIFTSRERSDLISRFLGGLHWYRMPAE